MWPWGIWIGNPGVLLLEAVESHSWRVKGVDSRGLEGRPTSWETQGVYL